MARRSLVSASLAGLFEVRVEAGMAVATAVLLADLGQLLHPRPSCKPTHHYSFSFHTLQPEVWRASRGSSDILA